ncbi:MAG: biotin/lipoyl-binding protein [Pseudonocardiaceae bacterium]
MRTPLDVFHLAIPALDLDDASWFYVEGLGCTSGSHSGTGRTATWSTVTLSHALSLRACCQAGTVNTSPLAHPTSSWPPAFLHLRLAYSRLLMPESSIARQRLRKDIVVLKPAIRRMLTKRWLIVGAVAVIGGAALGGWVWTGSQSETAPRLGTASLGTIRQTVSATGTIAPAQQANLSFGVSGQVTAVPATVGQQVQAGQALASVDSASLPNQLAQARAVVASNAAKVAADQAAGASAAQVNADNAALTSANAQLTVAQQNLSKATLTSPFAGTVAAVNLTVGQQVSGTSSSGSAGTGGSGTSSVASALTTSASNAQVVVISTGSYVVDASVDDTEVSQVKPDEQAVIMPNGAISQIFGTVASVGMVGSQSSGVATYPVVINVTGSPAGLPIGASAQVSIIVKQLTDVVVVPRGAVHQDNGKSVVYEMNGDQQVAHPVTVGLSAGGQTQITDGLAAGTRIVLPAAPTQTGSGGTGRGGGFGGGGGGRGPTGGTG